jgi:ectoine hydroxylase-related dioxygenase (phytanoyl-CoA dioxygenase family)
MGPRDPAANQHQDINCWLTHDGIRDLVLEGPGAAVAQQVFNSQRVSFYYDQIFVKEALSPAPTPWHHDATFWPLEGDQIASFWASVDAVSAETSALEFIAGSHRWKEDFRAIGLDGTDLTTGREGLHDLPDIEGDRSGYNIISWNLEPGDALMFHARTLHGARGNQSKHSKRRAIATRWCGDDVVYREGHMFEFYDHGLKDGDPFCASIYPQVWPHVIDEQIRPRMEGPILPDPDIMAKNLADLSKMDRTEVRADPEVLAVIEQQAS